ncbi:MAG: hypothetical protein KF787_05265 [Phycisphaeraceae bacterium]|nr:hypothetical protein [Phycisphaerae bacterium]MBX3392040.1 hypothetical protein [Phycisphaeraceae bacterium]
MNRTIRSALGRAFASRVVATLLTATVLVAPPLPARADEPIERVNAPYSGVRTDRRSDLVILPLLAAMDEPPRAVSDADALPLIVPGQVAWPEAAAWATAPNQKALIDGLYKVTEANDFKDSMIFALPYGVEDVSPDLVKARMYVELGDPPLLAAANIQYLPAIRTMTRLAHVEAIRRSSEGDVLGGMEVLARIAFFGRQLAERPMHAEVYLGYMMIWQAMERMADIAYTDFRGARSILSSGQAARLPDFINRLEEDRGVFAIDRLPFPTGNRAAAEQLISRVMQQRGGINQETFAATMARISAGGRPLRLFGEAGRWQLTAATQRDWFATLEELGKLYDDWQSRWRLDPFDPRMLQPFYATNLDKNQFPVLAASAPAISDLFPMRQFVRTSIAGVRHALGVLAFQYANRGWPPHLSSIRPNFIRAITSDPFNPNRARGQQPPFEYFVPIRDSVDPGPRDERRPHEMVVFVAGGQNFTIRLREDTFVLYSTGPDGGRNNADRIQNVWHVVKDTDLLLWPPVSSLWRQHLKDVGALK